MFIDYRGTIYTTHKPERCANQQRCVIHKPRVHGMSWWPAIMREDRDYLVERICPHGVGHPDPDSVWYFDVIRGETHAAVHGCDGCCKAALDIFAGVRYDEQGEIKNVTPRQRYLTR